MRNTGNKKTIAAQFEEAMEEDARFYFQQVALGYEIPEIAWRNDVYRNAKPLTRWQKFLRFFGVKHG